MTSLVGKGCLQAQLPAVGGKVACGMENEETKDASEWIRRRT